MSFLDLINQEQPTKQPKHSTTTIKQSPANQPTYITKNGIERKKPFKTSTVTEPIKRFSEVYARTANGVKAVEAAYPDRNLTYGSKAVQANRMLKNANVINHIEYQKNKLEKLATKAVKKVEQLIDSDNEQIATANVWKTIEQVQGKATIKSTSVNYNFTEHISDKGSKYGKYEG